MEEDREATNLGPEVPEEMPPPPTPPLKQPRKRFVGRRRAEEQGSSETTGLQATESHETAMSTRKPIRGPRVLNQVPASILDDADINAAIAHLPGNYNFEIHKTIHRIRTAGAKNVALQFPEGLLMFAPLISDILTQFCAGTETLIMGDVTYGACCIDDYTARALGCDLLVHYGHSCLVPVDTTQGIKVLYVFVTIGIDTEHLIATIERNFQTGRRLALVGTIQFNATLHSILPRLRSMGYDPFLPRSAPLSAGEILGCTAPSLVSKQHSTAPDNPLGADLILYVGDGRFHLESILIASPSLRSHTYRYDPYTRRLTHETFSHEEMHSLRQSAIATARRSLERAAPRETQHPETECIPVESTSAEPRAWAIILGTLGRQGNPNTLSLIASHLQERGIPMVTLLLSEVQPQKLSLMSADIAVWVQIACPRLSIDWGYAFERPLLSPYEALVALGVRDAKGWLSKEEGLASEVRRRNEAQKSNINDQNAEVARDTGSDRHGLVESSLPGYVEFDDHKVGVYPMDFYAKDGLARTRASDIPAASAGPLPKVVAT